MTVLHESWSKAHGRNRSCVFDPAVVRELSAVDRAKHLERTRALVGMGALARAIDAKDPGTRRHSDRVAALATRLAMAAGWAPAGSPARRRPWCTTSARSESPTRSCSGPER